MTLPSLIPPQNPTSSLSPHRPPKIPAISKPAKSSIPERQAQACSLSGTLNFRNSPDAVRTIGWVALSGAAATLSASAEAFRTLDLPKSAIISQEISQTNPRPDRPAHRRQTQHPQAPSPRTRRKRPPPPQTPGPSLPPQSPPAVARGRKNVSRLSQSENSSCPMGTNTRISKLRLSIITMQNYSNR